MKILSIGNSFSVDATRYLHQIARCDGFDLISMNIQIGGCPLIKHYQNMIGNYDRYELFLNGFSSNLKVTMMDALLSQEWDIVTIQQVSTKGPHYESFNPYLESVVDFIRECSPNSKIALQQTWAYRKDSPYYANNGLESHEDMFARVKDSYFKAAKAINADYIIPSGELVKTMLDSGIEKMHRDNSHLTYGLGRYSLGLLWYSLLTGNSIENNTFADFDEPVTTEEIKIAKECVEKVIEMYKGC